MDKYFDISSQELSNIQGLLPAISAAEMLQKEYPKISFALLEYSSQLIENNLVTFGSDQQTVDLLKKVKSKVKTLKIASVADLEKFADSLISSKNSQTSPELARLAALCYAATTIHGTINQKIAQKLINAQKLASPPVTDITSLYPTQNEPQNEAIEYPSSPPSRPQRAASHSIVKPPTEKPLHLILAEIAKEAFVHKDNDVALTALTAAITELQKA